MGYMDPAIEGATVTLVCPPQYALIGPDTTTCMGNGEWETDPREVECKGTAGTGPEIFHRGWLSGWLHA